MESIEILLRDIQGENRNIMRTLVGNVKGIRSGSLLVLTLSLMNPHSVEGYSIFCIDQHTQVISVSPALCCSRNMKKHFKLLISSHPIPHTKYQPSFVVILGKKKRINRLQAYYNSSEKFSTSFFRCTRSTT